MKILFIADEESKYLWDYYEKSKLENLDLMISCGDLKPEYLEFLVTMAKCPLLYIHGNHDTKYLQNPPEGCICIDDALFTYQGVRILGLGGSMKYHQQGLPFQCTEKQMQKRIRKRWLDLKLAHGFDILVTHSPAKDFNDLSDLPHQGFACFRNLLEEYHPKLFVHGHVHLNYGSLPRTAYYQNTLVINAYERYFYDDCQNAQKS
ncbi:MAG: metallophosphoesterase family protein [Oscillospiraceae bacterium]|nr:metallophosphoesterase family protein [Oscillospiraceae bacterium]